MIQIKKNSAQRMAALIFEKINPDDISEIDLSNKLMAYSISIKDYIVTYQTEMINDSFSSSN
jgi:hypothetical protein